MLHFFQYYNLFIRFPPSIMLKCIYFVFCLDVRLLPVLLDIKHPVRIHPQRLVVWTLLLLNKSILCVKSFVIVVFFLSVPPRVIAPVGIISQDVEMRITVLPGIAVKFGF